jgi:predicted Zn-dependent protease with MMP-like domain
MSIDQEFNDEVKPVKAMPGGKSAALGSGVSDKEFDALVAEAFEAVPEKFRSKVKNVALLIEDEPSEATLKENNVPEGHTLLGLYHGIPATERGDGYGVGATLPDTITVFRKPILDAAAEESGVDFDWGPPTEKMKKRIRDIIRDTIWHEIAHYFGMDEFEVDARETEGTNEFKP